MGLNLCIRLLEKAGVVKQPEAGFSIDLFVNREVVKLT